MRAAALSGLGIALLAISAPANADPRTPGVVAAIQAQLGADGFGPDARFTVAFADLNDDHHDEAIVYLSGRNFCGSGGCTTFVLTETEVGWLQIGRMTLSRLPIYRLPDHHGGWFDLGVYVSGGGAQPGVRSVRYENDRYRSNASRGATVARLPQQATRVLAADAEMIPIAAQ